jgi:hypothetical protein
MRHRLAFCLAAAAALAAAACGPTVNPAAQADLDRRLAEIAPNEETYPPSEAYLPMAFMVGQWTEHRITDAQGHASLITLKLVGQENDAYWLEVVTESAQGREAAKILVALTSGRDPAGINVRAIHVKKEGQAQSVEVQPGQMTEVKGRFHAALDLLAMPVDTNEKDDVRVPGGHFIGCYKVEISRPWGPWQEASTACSHPSVPLSGVVRAAPVGKGGLLELVDFGVSGAESEL